MSVNGRLPLARKSSLVNLNYALIEKFWGNILGNQEILRVVLWEIRYFGFEKSSLSSVTDRLQ